MLNLKVGDEAVLSYTTSSRTIYKIVTISDETKTFFITENGQRFIKKTGIKHGSAFYGVYETICEVNEESLALVENCERETMKMMIEGIVHSLPHKCFSNDELQDLYDQLQTIQERFLYPLSKEKQSDK